SWRSLSLPAWADVATMSATSKAATARISPNENEAAEDASDIDGQAERPSKRERTSQKDQPPLVRTPRAGKPRGRRYSREGSGDGAGVRASTSVACNERVFIK